MEVKDTRKIRKLGREANEHVRNASDYMGDLDARPRSEKCLLLCADTQLMLAEQDIKDARRMIRERRIERGDITRTSGPGE